METTRLSSKGQVIIPKALRTAHRWESGLELLVIDTGDGVLLKPKAPFEETSLDSVAACLPYRGEARTADDIERAIREGARSAWRDSD